MNNKGFTLIEVIAVIAILAIVLALAAPNIFKLNDRANEKSYQAKIDNLRSIIELYFENNSNDIVDKCKKSENCICNNFSGSNSEYSCIFSLQKVLDLNLYKESCTPQNNNDCICKISNPIDENDCLTTKSFDVTINTASNTAHAVFRK